MTTSKNRMPHRGDIFRGAINDLTQSDSTGWRRRDITFYRTEINAGQTYGYPRQGDSIVLIGISGESYSCRFSKPETQDRICLGTPASLKPWYRKNGYNDQHVNQVRRDGYQDHVYFEYIGEGSRFYIYPAKDYKGKRVWRSST